MIVRVSLEFPDRYRRAINFVIGKRGLATRTQCIAHVDMMLDADAGELASEMDAMIEAKKLRKRR